MTSVSHLAQDDPHEVAAGWCLRIVQGPLTLTEQADFQAWLAADAVHAEAFDEVAETWDIVERHAVAPEMLALREAAMATARRAHRDRWLGLPRRQRSAVFGLAASVAAALVLGGVWFSQQPRIYETGVGERQLVRLKDGSTVSLDGDTEVRVRFADNRRELWLERGRARFNVAKDPLRPFSVDADGRVVIATGTSFSVERLSRQVRVVLYEGRVAVLDDKVARPPDNLRATGADQILDINEEMVIPDQSAVAAAPIVPADPVRSASWEGGLLTFQAELLPTAVERMNRYSSQPLRVDPSAANIRVSGVFKAGDTVSFVEGITVVLPVEARRGDAGISLHAATD